VCNADEGEPGTFKDRELLAHHADLVIEGMTVAGFAVGAQRGLIYLRAEYPFLVAPLGEALARRRAPGCSAGGRRRAGFDFDIELHLGAGAYVCGEESALLESLEGKRGIPRNRPPYPVTHGYRQKPTVVNNVETLAAAALIARTAPAWCARRHAEVAGHQAPVGVGRRRAPRDLRVPVRRHGAAGARRRRRRRTQAVQVGGPSGTLLAAASSGGGSRSRTCRAPARSWCSTTRRDMLAVVENFARFFAHESCGFCTPCRVGTTLAAQMMTRIATGVGLAARRQGPGASRQRDEGGEPLRPGRDRGRPVVDALAKFRPAFEHRLRSLDVLPTFDLDEALAPAREATGRDDAGALRRGGPMTDAAATFQLDGARRAVRARPVDPGGGAGRRHYIPHLCYHPEFAPHGSCKVCTVKVNGRTHASCTTPAHAGDVVESNDRRADRAAAQPRAVPVHRGQPLLPVVRGAAAARCRAWPTSWA
jgi:[NiFe] hydrogenase diaphorase moiety large subunit